MSCEPDVRRRVVIGVGNPDRGDDGVGPMVMSMLRGQLPSDVRIEHRLGGAMALIDVLREADVAVLVDAMVSGGRAGSILRLDCSAVDVSLPVGAASSHGLGVAEAIALARLLGCLPRRCVVFAVEGVRFELGSAISPPVAGAVAGVAARVRAELTSLSGSR
jgi:hydrogenase maturation protease